MIQIHFILSDGSRLSFEARPGDTVMDVALDNGVPGIIAQCGGGATCCTCHCWVRPPWSARFSEPPSYERELLDYAWGMDEHSRLSCQLTLDAAHADLEVFVPEQQA
ncbi:MAG: 2Fe-2S iron-sulfur cluster-binding protein [Pseudomonadota bacterium]